MPKKSIEALRKELNKKADLANKYLTQLDAEDNFTQAYHVAYLYFNTDDRKKLRFKRGVKRQSKGDVDVERESINTELKAINRFLQSETHSTKGMMKAIQNRLKALEESSGQSGLTMKQQNVLYALLNSDAYARASEAAGDSDPIEELVAGAVVDGTRNIRGSFSRIQVDEITKILDYWTINSDGDVKELEKYFKEYFELKK